MHDDMKTLVEKAKKKGVYGSSCVIDCNIYKVRWLLMKLSYVIIVCVMCNS